MPVHGRGDPVLQLLDASALRRWVDLCVESLSQHAAEIDALNVFPVADADTGTNLLHTVRAAQAELSAAAPPGYSAAAAVLARGALTGARGNSGVIVSQLFRGLADGGGTGRGLTGTDLVAALRRADALAYQAVSDPVAGTVLTVLHAAADAAAEAGRDACLPEVTRAAATAAATALADTPRLLPVLARAGVVDAGGRGLQLLLEALVTVVTGAPPTEQPLAASAVTARPAGVLTTERDHGSSAHEYEVMYLLDQASDARVAQLRGVLERLGDSVVIVGAGDGEGETNSVHVHCTDVGAAIEAGVRAGNPHRITVVRFADAAQPTAAAPKSRALLAIVPGAAAADLFAAEGAAVLRWDSSGADAAAVREAIEGTGAGHVTLLPNGLITAPDLTEVVADVRRAGQGVTVLPTGSPVQGLAALAVHDPTRDSDDDTVAMAEAASATRRGSVRVAAEQALTWAGRCEPGDVLGLLDDEVVLIGRAGDPGVRQSEVVRGLLDRVLDAGGELVTVLTGVDLHPGTPAVMQEHVRTVHPGVELVVYAGGLTADILLLGVE